MAIKSTFAPSTMTTMTKTGGGTGGRRGRSFRFGFFSLSFLLWTCSFLLLMTSFSSSSSWSWSSWSWSSSSSSSLLCEAKSSSSSSSSSSTPPIDLNWKADHAFLRAYNVGLMLLDGTSYAFLSDGQKRARKRMKRRHRHTIDPPVDSGIGGESIGWEHDWYEDDRQRLLRFRFNQPHNGTTTSTFSTSTSTSTSTFSTDTPPSAPPPPPPTPIFWQLYEAVTMDNHNETLGVVAQYGETIPHLSVPEPYHYLFCDYVEFDFLLNDTSPGNMARFVGHDVTIGAFLPGEYEPPPDVDALSVDDIGVDDDDDDHNGNNNDNNNNNSTGDDDRGIYHLCPRRTHACFATNGRVGCVPRSLLSYRERLDIATRGGEGIPVDPNRRSSGRGESRRRRHPFRIFMWFLVVVGSIGGGYVYWKKRQDGDGGLLGGGSDSGGGADGIFYQLIGQQSSSS